MSKFHSINSLKNKKDIRYILFNKFLVIISFCALLIMGIHIYNQRPFVNILTALAIGVLCIVWYVMSKILLLYDFARISFLIFITFIYVPFGYWTSPGSESSIMYIVILTVFMLSFTAKRLWENIFSVIVVIETLILLRTELWFPKHYYIYEDEKYRILDLSLNFTVMIAVMIYTIIFVNRRSAKHSEELYEISITDSLTGLYNYRFFSDYIQTEYNRAQRNNQIFTVVMMDINNFKQVNDRYGHLEGDRVLNEIATLIKSNIRNYDVAFRYGGDEFVIVLPETSKEIANALVERLKQSYEEYCKKYHEIQFSVAVGYEDSKGKSLEELYQLADELMYKEKKKQKQEL